MRFRPLGILLASGALAAIAWLHAARLDAPPALAAPAAAAPAESPGETAPAPVALLLATRPGVAHTTLHRAPLRSADPGPPVATITHLPDAAVRGATLPGTDVVMMTADTTPGRDLFFNATLFRVEPHTPPVPLCDRVVHASRTLVTDAGRVFVSRGLAGPDPAIGPNGKVATLRVDALSVDEIDPATGATRTVLTYSGYATFLAAAWKHEIVVYRVSPAGADLVAIDPDAGTERPVAALLPYARDFSIDTAAGALLFQERHETDPHSWVIDSLDLATARRTRLLESRSHALAPHAWPGGGIAYTPDPRAGLHLLGTAAAVRAPLGPGVDAIETISLSSTHPWVALLHAAPGVFPVPFAVRADTGDLAAIPAPPGARVAIAGLVAGKAGAP